MEINLDRDSAPVYGLGVNYLEVTDTRLLSETIIFKGYLLCETLGGIFLNK